MERSRKRSRRVGSSRLVNDDSPLQNVVVCLTGIPPGEKDQLHKLVEALGGKYTRDLNPATTTHLVAHQADGAKYEAALAMPHVKIVAKTWLFECQSQKKLVPETQHALLLPESTFQQEESLAEATDRQLNNSSHSSGTLFAGCLFYLIGFEESDYLVPLSKLIRRGLGTIYWECQDDVTHVIVNDDSDPEWTRGLSLGAGPVPTLVSPWWILTSLKDNKLAGTQQFYPKYRARVEKKKYEDANRLPGKEKGTLLFRDCFFIFLRAAPPSWAVDYDSSELEKAVQKHSGQVFTSKIVDALKSDRLSMKEGEYTKRTCYLVCWGGCDAASEQAVHPTLVQLTRHDLCDLVEVTPVWLHTSMEQQKCLDPSKFPEAFKPLRHPIHAFPKQHKDTTSSKSSVRISVSGFSAIKRTALMFLIQAMGGVFDNSMRTNTTHLICNEPSGQKYEKANEWKIHATTVDWLYHVMRHGCDGQNGNSGAGCEDRFYFTSENKT